MISMQDLYLPESLITDIKMGTRDIPVEYLYTYCRLSCFRPHLPVIMEPLCDSRL